MTEGKNNDERIVELEAEIEELKNALAEHQEKNEAKRLIDFNKVKTAIDDSARGIMAAVKPVIEKYEEPGRAAVAKVGNRVSDNPFLSVMVAFGVGIVIGKIIDCCCCGKED